MARKLFYFVRHGESILNSRGVRQGSEGSLSEKGKEQATETGKRFENRPVDVVLVWFKISEPLNCNPNFKEDNDKLWWDNKLKFLSEYFLCLSISPIMPVNVIDANPTWTAIIKMDAISNFFMCL